MNKILKIIFAMLIALKKILKKSKLDNKFFEWWVNNYLYPLLQENKQDKWLNIIYKTLPIKIYKKLDKIPLYNNNINFLCEWLIKQYNKHF